MRYLVIFLVASAGLAACGGSSSSPKPNGSPGPIVATIPRTSPVPVKTVKGIPTVNPNATPIKLPTTRPIALPTPTDFPPSAYTALLHGIVTDARTHKPLAGAFVRIGRTGRPSTVTSSSGRYSISFPGGPPVEVRIDKKGYFEYLAMGQLVPHGHYKRDVALSPKIPGAAPPAPSFFSAS
jgi:hypothetical protein